LSFKDHLRGIDWSDLSQTFKDAITLTRRLGHKYIWIDSLCIIQEDENDWQRESAKMASIYESSILTIAATRASDGTKGIFPLAIKDSKQIWRQDPHFHLGQSSMKTGAKRINLHRYTYIDKFNIKNSPPTLMGILFLAAHGHFKNVFLANE
jgi:hypothetical protein